MDNFSKNLLIVDRNDKIVGVEKVINAHYRKSLMLHRAFSLFLFNSSGNLLLQKRSSSKLVFPSRWTNTCCSHPFVNKMSFTDPVLDVKNHIVHRMKYELGVSNVHQEDLQFVTRVYYKATVQESDGVVINGYPEKQEYKEFECNEKLVETEDSKDFGEWEVDYIFICIKDVDVDINRDEVSDVKYVTKKEFKNLLVSEDISPWLSVICKYIDIFDEAEKALTK